MSYTVYMHTSPSGKRYIGITGRAPSRRYHGGSAYRSNHHFYSAIKKYGWESFMHDIIAEGLSREDACAMEIKLIAEYHTTDPEFGYNRSKGGDKTTLGYTMSEETKAKISAKARGRTLPHTPEWNRKIGEANRGRTVSPETRDKLRACLGDRFRTPEAIAKQKANTPKGASHAKSKAVVCTETGELSPTISEAATCLKTSRANIAHAIKGYRGQKLAAGFHWRWATSEELYETKG